MVIDIEKLGSSYLNSSLSFFFIEYYLLVMDEAWRDRPTCPSK